MTYQPLPGTTALVVHQKCGICWETKCDHWSVVEETKEVKTFLGSKHTVGHKITCTTCKARSSWTLDTARIAVNLFSCYTCSKKNSCLFLASTPIADTTLAEYFGYYLRSKCTDCKGAGTVSRPTCAKCTACDGMGGVTCTKCFGAGHKWVTQSSLSPAYVTTSCVEPCTCTQGFSMLCYGCMGAKAILKTAASFTCRSCR